MYGSLAKRTWSLMTTSLDSQLMTSMGCDNKNQGDPLQPQYMPLEDTLNQTPVSMAVARVIYRAGDIRANELPLLMVKHTLWMRKHNRLAKLLSHVNPH